MNKLTIGIIFIITCSIAWDIFTIIQSRARKKFLENYIAFEQADIELARQELIKQIKTSIDFKNPRRRNQLSYLSDFETFSLEMLEDKMLVMYSDLTTLDSLPYGSDDIPKYRQRMNIAKNHAIRALYKDLLIIAMLEKLASDVYDDSACGFYDLGWKMIRPISSDSVYIGSVFKPDGRSKHAFQINGQYFEVRNTSGYNGIYFEELQNSNIYTLPKADTLNIYTIGMRNRFTRIDTIINNQRIKFDGKKWRIVEP